MTDDATATPVIDNVVGPALLRRLASLRPAPVARDAMGFRTFLRYSDVKALLHDDRLRNYGFDLLSFQGVTEGPLRELFGNLMFNNEGDTHHRLRRLVSKAFTPRSVEALRSTVQAFVDTRIAAIVEREEGDVVGSRDLWRSGRCAMCSACHVRTSPSSKIGPSTSAWLSAS